MSNKSKNVIVKKACEIISNNLGSVTAEYYYEFYQDKDNDLILESLGELLEEIVGPQKAKKNILGIRQLIKNNK